MPFERRDHSLDIAAFHALEVRAGGRRVWVPQLGPRRTLVLGSSQPETDVDPRRCAELGVEIVRRRTGGGAVLVSDADLVWFDLLIDRADTLWDDDVAVAFDWVGRAVGSALAALGHGDATMHGGPLQRTEWSRRVCFAGLGRGELSIGGRKVVGISQRRTREAARFQVAALRRWSGAEQAELLRLTNAERAAAATSLDSVAAGIGLDNAELIDAVLAQLATV